MAENTARSPGVTPDGLPPHLREAHDRLAFGAAEVLPANGLAERLLAADREGRPLRVKLGIDPSGASLTLGHAVVLRKLRQFQDLGHTAVLIVGGFTGRVGDPTGRTATRGALTAEQTTQNSKRYFEQVMRVLDPDRVEIRDNAEWLDPMTMAEIMSYAREVTVARLLERDDFAKRYREHLPISLTEFFYPLLQGIDSVAVRSDVEIGGTDQTFNNLMGRDLQRAHGQAAQAVLTVPLLVGTDGVEKMGKSLGNWIGIEESADEQFGKVMSIPDPVIGHYARLATDLLPAEVGTLEAAAEGGGPAANRAKRRVAAQVVTLYHGAEAARAAEHRFDTVHRQHEVPEDLPERGLPPGDPVHLPALLVELGFAKSSSAARRLVDDGAVKLDGERLPARGYDLDRDRLAGHVLAAGKRHLVRLTA
ncbi:MAG: Tyrosyl-tRNA synthetase [uncultured Corynebacteriales bacterium]|uniref:Tyrosine--tRNA ligase n=1 Tax=uncultured Mycobacteriales bacterium TaxID=581187 RepID=A0A6J4IZ40_9ACTN|nr:MAG: Tyrosyl-tRNA synthetase [uncultured Corynebacteriales bacterium]